MNRAAFKDLTDQIDLLEKHNALIADQIRLLRRRVETVAENDSALPQLNLNIRGIGNVAKNKK